MATAGTVTLKVKTELSPILTKGLRETIREQLILHQYRNGQCSCGEAPLGEQFSDHAANAIMEQL